MDSEKPSDASHEWGRPNVIASVASSKFCVKSSQGMTSAFRGNTATFCSVLTRYCRTRQERPSFWLTATAVNTAGYRLSSRDTSIGSTKGNP